MERPWFIRTETVIGAASAPASEFKAAWLCSPSSCSGLARPGLAQFMLAGQDGIRTCGSWIRAAEGMKRLRWVKLLGWIHSAVRETASRQNQNMEFRTRQRRGTNRQQAAFHSPQPTGSFPSSLPHPNGNICSLF